MRRVKKIRGFSLMEVNMAIFVMAIGVLSMVALFPLGIRESIQSQEDLKQSMFADYMLNAIVSVVSSPTLPWSDWSQWALEHQLTRIAEGDPVYDLKNLPLFVENAVKKAEMEYNSSGHPSQLNRNQTYAVYCVPVIPGDPGHSSLVMGILVRSLSMDTSDMDPEEMMRRLEAQPVYYAEARFQGTIQ